MRATQSSTCDVQTSDDVIFAEAGDMVLLGARTLEGLNLRVDPVRHVLVDAGPVDAARVRADPVVALASD